jgi:tetratricopeptide (TPR) repeat protein
VLNLLRDRLRGSSATWVLPTPQSLCGLGGVGKTQVALEYAHRFMADYDLVWWIDAQQPEYVAPQLIDLGGRLDLPVGDNVMENAELVRETLRLSTHPKARRWLLLFDNALNAAEILRFLPGGSGHVLVTSRDPGWSVHAQPTEVDVFGRKESVDHLCRRVPGISQEEAEQVAEAVGDLPLAVEIAAAWLESTGTPVNTYVEQLRQESVRVLDAPTPSDYPLAFREAWRVSLARLSDESPAALRLLQLCAFLAPDPIATNLLYSNETIRVLRPYDDELRDPTRLGQVIQTIGRYGLAKVDNTDHVIQVHRLVQAVIRAELAPGEHEELRHHVHRILVGARPLGGDTDDPGNWPRFQLIWPHLLPSRAEECDEADTRQLFLDRIHYLCMRGELGLAEELCQRLDQLWAEKLGADDRHTLLVRFHLADVLRRRGRVHEAWELDQDTHARQRRVLPLNHPDTLRTAGGLAADLRAQGHFAEARGLDEEAYHRSRDQFGEDHPLSLDLANNLAIDLRFVGEYDSARHLDAEVRDIRVSVLGPRHPSTLTSTANLAGDLRELGDYQGSVALLDDFRESYPVLAPDLLRLRYAKSLAVSLRKAGRVSEAQRLTLETYNHYLAAFPSELPDALACALNLAADYFGTGDNAAAWETAERVYQMYRQTLGDDHPFTLISGNNVGIYLRETGRTAEAVALGERVVAGLREQLGAEHAYAWTAMLNLANSLAEGGDLAQAEAIGRTALTGLADRCGSTHPNTLACTSNLAVTLRDRREPTAQLHRTQAIESLIRHLGEEHPSTQSARAWRRIHCDLEVLPT